MQCPGCSFINSTDNRFCARCGTSLTGATGRLNPDTILENRYVILKTVGQGGMGAVYLALDTRLNHITVAIKEMSFQASGGDISTAIAAFQKEASLLTNLHHPALPTVRDFFSRENRWYLVMDYIEGETLQDIAQRRGSIPEVEVLDWAQQLCNILEYLHNQNPPVIFRDLKPSNIMLTPTGEIKLIDFGIARHFRPGSTSDTAAFISSGFAPPEQYGANQTDARSDIYALGATLHYLLTGINPAPNPFSFDSPSKYAQVSPRMDTAVMKALKLKAEERPQDVKEMLGLLPNGAVRLAVTPTPETSKNLENPVTEVATTPLPMITPTSSTNLLTGLIPDAAPDALPRTTPLQISANLNEANSTSAATTRSEEKTIADLTAAKTTPVPAESISPLTTEFSTKRKSKKGFIAAIILLLLLIPGGWLVWANVQGSGSNIPVHNTASSDTPDNNSEASLVSGADKEGADAAEDGLEKNISHSNVNSNIGNLTQGELKLPDGGKYSGQIKDGIANGQGTATFPNSDRYEGQWNNGKKNGQGTYYWSDGARYEGEWKNDQKNGKGKIYWPDGAWYEGEWENDKKNGQGIVYWPNGFRYDGQWKDDQQNGQGTLYRPDGTHQTGIWRGDSLLR